MHTVTRCRSVATLTTQRTTAARKTYHLFNATFFTKLCLVFASIKVPLHVATRVIPPSVLSHPPGTPLAVYATCQEAESLKDPQNGRT